MGVNTFRAKLAAFAISAFITGLTGGVHAAYLGTIEPYSIFSLAWTIAAVNIVIIGGIGALVGPLIWAIFVAIFSKMVAAFHTLPLIIYCVIPLLLRPFITLRMW